MGKDLLSFYDEDDIGKSFIVDDLPHVLNQRVNSLIVDFVLFKFPDIKDADVIQPFATIKATEDEELFSSDDTSSVSLSTSRSFVTFCRVTPSHVISVKDIKVIGWDDLLKGAASTIVPTKQVNLIPDQVGSVSS